MSTPDQLLGDLAGPRQHHLEPLRGREAALVRQLEVELVVLARGSRGHLEDLGHHAILSAARPRYRANVSVEKRGAEELVSLPTHRSGQG